MTSILPTAADRSSEWIKDLPGNFPNQPFGYPLRVWEGSSPNSRR
jgi:hypothetical protein